MLYRIRKAVAHPDHTVTVTWSDGVEALVDLSPVIAKGNVFAPLQDGHYFATNMRIADDRLGHRMAEPRRFLGGWFAFQGVSG